MRHTKGHGTQKTVIYDGIKFWNTEQGYYLGSVNGKPKRLHIYVWEKYNGEIPKGYDIHHIDGNRENNDINNLQMLLEKEHHQIHCNQPERIESAKRNIVQAIAKAPEWHRSEAGREWHKSQWNNSIGKHMNEKVIKVCQVCGKRYETISMMAYKSKFCGNNCKAKALRRRRAAERTAKCVSSE